MNVNIYYTKVYKNETASGFGKNKPNSNPNKPNFQKAKMNVSSIITKDYRKKDDFAVRKNKPNSNPISSKAKMNANAFSQKDYENETTLRPQKTNPKQTQFQTRRRFFCLLHKRLPRPSIPWPSGDKCEMLDTVMIWQNKEKTNIGKSGNVGAAAPKKTKVRDENQTSQAGETTAGGRKTADNQAKQANPRNKRQPQGTFWVENGTRYRVIPGQPYYIAKNSMDLFENGLKEDEKVGACVIELLEKYKDRPFFFFVHFAEVDHVGHKHGESSKECNDALISNDLWTGKIMAKVRELGLGDKTQLIFPEKCCKFCYKWNYRICD